MSDHELTGARLTAEAHCDQGRPHPDELPGSVHTEIVRAAPGPATWFDAPIRWPDLETPSLLLALVAQWLPVPVLVVDTTASAVFCNRAWSAVTGLSRTDSLGRGWQSAIDSAAHRSTRERVLAAGGRACEIAMVHASEAHSRRTRLLMEPLLAFDGSLLGKVLWVPELGSPEARGVDDQRGSGLESWDDGTATAFIALVQHALEAHQHATTTIAVLVIEVDPAPVGPDAEAIWQPAWEVGIDQALVGRIEPLLGGLQVLVSVGHHKLAVLCEQVMTYREVIVLAELVVEISDDPPLVGGVAQALILSVGVAFPHLPGEQGEALLAHAIGAASLARAQGLSGYEVVIGTGPGSSDVMWPPGVQEQLSAPSARLQPRTPS